MSRQLPIKTEEDYLRTFGDKAIYISEKKFDKIKKDTNLIFIKYLMKFHVYEDFYSDNFIVFTPFFRRDEAEERFVEYGDIYEIMELIKPNVRE